MIQAGPNWVLNLRAHRHPNITPWVLIHLADSVLLLLRLGRLHLVVQDSHLPSGLPCLLLLDLLGPMEPERLDDVYQCRQDQTLFNNSTQTLILTLPTRPRWVHLTRAAPVIQASTPARPLQLSASRNLTRVHQEKIGEEGLGTHQAIQGQTTTTAAQPQVASLTHRLLMLLSQRMLSTPLLLLVKLRGCLALRVSIMYSTGHRLHLGDSPALCKPIPPLRDP